MIFDKVEFINQFSGALSRIENASQIGKELANEGINRIICAGCGAPFYMMRLLAYWGQKHAINTDIRVYYSAELISQNPAAINENTQKGRAS